MVRMYICLISTTQTKGVECVTNPNIRISIREGNIDLLCHPHPLVKTQFNSVADRFKDHQTELPDLYNYVQIW